MTPQALEHLERDGITVLPGFADRALVSDLAEEFGTLAGTAPASHRHGAVFGIRGALGKSRMLRGLAEGALFLGVARAVLGASARAIRGVLFDKTEAANWPLPWHQDKTAALRGDARPQGFVNWTEKEAVTHAELPLDYLHQMVTLRLHLDACDTETGALLVLPGRHGAKHRDTELRDEGRARGRTVSVKAGDLVVMRPLTPHASHRVTRPCRRRVVHIEYCAKPLPAGLEWEEAA